MKQIVLRNKGQEFVYKILGTLVGISAVLQLFLNSPRSWLFWVNAVLVIMLFVLFITRGFGTNVNSIIYDDNTLSIRWYNRLRVRRIGVSEIAEIASDKKCINIKLKNARVIRIPVNILEAKDQLDVRNFLKETTGL
jgi:hypothetical protein